MHWLLMYVLLLLYICCYGLYTVYCTQGCVDSEHWILYVSVIGWWNCLLPVLFWFAQNHIQWWIQRGMRGRHTAIICPTIYSGGSRGEWGGGIRQLFAREKYLQSLAYLIILVMCLANCYNEKIFFDSKCTKKSGGSLRCSPRPPS